MSAVKRAAPDLVIMFAALAHNAPTGAQAISDLAESHQPQSSLPKEYLLIAL
jgi:hypothetical protein